MTKLSPLDCRPGPDVTASDRMRICLAGRPEYHASLVRDLSDNLGLGHSKNQIGADDFALAKS